MFGHYSGKFLCYWCWWFCMTWLLYYDIFFIYIWHGPAQHVHFSTHTLILGHHGMGTLLYQTIHNLLFELCTGLFKKVYLQLFLKMCACFVSSVFVFVQKLHFTFLHLKRAHESQGNIYVCPWVRLVWYWFSEDHLTQYNPFCTSIITSNQITRAHSDYIIIKNGHCSQRRTSVGWCKCHDEFRIATSL